VWNDYHKNENNTELLLKYSAWVIQFLFNVAELDVINSAMEMMMSERQSRWRLRLALPAGMSLAVGRFLGVCYRLGQLCTHAPNSADMAAHAASAGSSLDAERQPQASPDPLASARRGWRTEPLTFLRSSSLIFGKYGNSMSFKSFCVVFLFLFRK
jgi:hypothetical protein